MKKRLFLAVLGLSIVLAYQAFAADKDTKSAPKVATPIEELNYKYEKLIQLNYARHNEILKLLKEIREQGRTQEVIVAPVSPPVTVSEATTSVSTVQTADTGRAAIPETPAVPVTSTTETVAEAPVAAARAVVEAVPSPSAENHETTAPVAEPAVTPVTTVAPAPEPVPAIQAPMVVSSEPDPKLLRELNNTHSFAVLAFLVSLLSLVCMGILIATVRKNDEKLRRMLWKSEVDTLRDEVMSGRPHLKVEKSFDRLTLTNDGAVAADEIKLSLGPAPRTMKQRLRVLTRIEASEKAEVEIGPQQATDGQIYGTLEYKNPDNGKLFKDQFVLKIDGVTGELVPVSQAV